MQRTRCYYFYDVDAPCNKREPGSGCGAIGGVTRIHAILGASDKCIATYPGDMAVAMTALDAVVEVEGPDGRRDIPVTDFHRLPGDHPERDTNSGPGEMIRQFAFRRRWVAGRSIARFATAGPMRLRWCLSPPWS